MVSLLFPIITYTDKRGGVHPFNIFKLLGGGFAAIVQEEYTGGSLIDMSNGAFDLVVAIVSLIGAAAAIVASFVGIRSMAKQYESQWPFRMTVCGLVGTAIPALLLIIAGMLSSSSYMGKISLGAYVIVTPLAMVVSVLTVVRRHRLTRTELEIQKEAASYIHVAGDLPRQ